MEKNEFIKKYLFWIVLFVISIILFEFVGAQTPATDYGDTITYTAMKSFAPPLYPCFLAILRMIVGEEIYLQVATVIQGLLAAAVIMWFCYEIKKMFKLTNAITVLVYLASLIPYIINTMWDEPRYILTKGIFTESLAISFFYLYVIFLLKGLKEESEKNVYITGLIAVLLTWTRSQMIFMLGFSFLAFFYLGIVKKEIIKNILKGILLMLVAFVLIQAGGKGYKYATSNETDSAYYQLYPLIHLIYCSDIEDAARYEDEEEKQLFIKAYEAFDEMGYNYKYSGTGFYEKGNHYASLLGESNAALSGCLTEYAIKHNLTEQEQQIEIIRKIEFPLIHRVGRWLFYAFQEFPIALACSIFIIYPPLKTFCFFITYIIVILAIGLMVWEFRRNRKSLSALFMLFVLMFDAINIILTATWIRLVVRYHLYIYGMFYIAFLLMLVDAVKYIKTEKDKCVTLVDE